MDTTVVILIIVVVVLVILVAALGYRVFQRKRSEQLQKHFGPEYERSLSETGDREAAETELQERQERRSELDIRDLRPEERSGFQKSWTTIQGDFVDDPERALRGADVLVVEIMSARGYPVDDFDRRAQDISVDHPDVVQHYREARSVRDASTSGTVDTELQRRAITSYRSLVEALLGHGGEERPKHRATRLEDTDHHTDTTGPTQERTR